MLTTWQIEAPLAQVYAAVLDSVHWPEWWQSVCKVEQMSSGGVDGIGSMWRYSWQGRLPYQVVFVVRVKHIENMVTIVGVTQGDLVGLGRWSFYRQGSVSIVHCEWRVRSTRWWMNLVAPLARSIFIRNHARVMAQGGQGLARLLGSPWVKQQTIDLLAAANQPSIVLVEALEMGEVDMPMVLIVGLCAGVIAALTQLLLWWLSGAPVAEMLFRDVRLTAALVLGSGVLPPPSTPQWDVLLVATCIHFTLSIIYALIPAYQAQRLRTASTIFAGPLYGLAIYGANLYGLTLLFPWFAVARDWITLVTHLVFGVALVTGCWLYAQQAMGAPCKKHHHAS